VVIGYAEDISVKALANLIKEYSMDSLTPAIVAGEADFHLERALLTVGSSS